MPLCAKSSYLCLASLNYLKICWARRKLNKGRLRLFPAAFVHPGIDPANAADFRAGALNVRKILGV
jgi:hypothetical protein